MKGVMTRWICTLLLLAGSGLSGFGLLAQAQPKITLEGLSAALKNKAIAPVRLVREVERRGVDFPSSPENLKLLRDLGATPELIALIEKLAPAPPPPPPKPSTAGPIQIQCAPAECEVLVNGQPAGSTRGGRLSIPAVPTGKPTAVDFRKSGYVSAQDVRTYEAGKALTLNVRLKPTNETVRAEGTAVYEKAVARYGGAAALASTAGVTGQGEVKLFTGEGMPSAFDLEATLLAPGLVRMRFESAKKDWIVSFKGRDKLKSDGKLRGSPFVMEFETITREFRDYYPVNLLNRIQAERMELSAEPEPAGSTRDRVLRASSASGSTTVLTFSHEFALKKAALEGGLGGGLSVTYGDEESVNNSPQPKLLVITFADKAQHGAEFRFVSLKTAGKLTERDFRR
jgi:hypothetical protein